MPEAPDDQYFRRVEEHFGRRRGGPLVLSPKDWRLLEKWQRQGIPLRVVLRGINEAFDRFAASGPRADRINSLRYCEQEVHAAWEDHRAAHRRRDPESGGASSPALPAASRHLLAVAAACRSSAENQAEEVASCLARAASALDALEQEAAEGLLGARDLDQRAAELQAHLQAELQHLAEGDPAPAHLDLPPFSPYET